MSFFNWFVDPVKNHYADFSGRITRKAYWMFVLIYVIIAVLIGLLEVVIGLNFLSAIYTLAVLVPTIALAARRLHDTGLSGWWQLVSLLPFIGAVVLIILLIRKSQEGENKYGPNPHGQMASPVGEVPA